MESKRDPQSVFRARLAGVLVEMSCSILPGSDLAAAAHSKTGHLQLAGGRFKMEPTAIMHRVAELPLRGTTVNHWCRRFASRRLGKIWRPCSASYFWDRSRGGSQGQPAAEWQRVRSRTPQPCISWVVESKRDPQSFFRARLAEQEVPRIDSFSQYSNQ